MTRLFLVAILLWASCAIAQAQTAANDSANSNLSNLRSTAINVDLLPTSEASKNLGSTSKRWRSIISHMGLFGNATSEAALLNVMSDGTDFGGDWIAWFRHEGNAVNNESLIRHQHYSQGYAPQPIITGVAARGTIAAPAALHVGDYLFILDGRGYDGSTKNYSQGQLGFSDTSAQIAFQTAQDWNASTHGSKITFKTTSNGSIVPAARMVIDQDGMVAVNPPGVSLVGGASLSIIEGASHVNSGSPNNDRSGTLNLAGSTSATHAFASAYVSVPICVVAPLQDMGNARWWVSNTAANVTVNVSASGTYKFNYWCVGNPY
ncbi:MAG TPA: hypothetical protein VNG71_15595 [Pyrinomonadaceae bacterium]|nr:hypothetical protein [Pyrinomonadaceae bacterium]